MNVLNGNFSSFCNGMIFILLVEIKCEKKNILQKQVQDFKGSLLIQNISKNAFTFSQSMYWFLYAQTGNFTTVPEYFGDEFPYEF